MAFLKFLKSKIRRRSKRVEDVHDIHQPAGSPKTTTTIITQKLPDRPDASDKISNNNKIIPSNPCSSSWVPKRFSWEEIERLTMNFTSPVIGEGGFSNVYLSHFSDSSLGALKIPSTTNSERLNRMFKQELEVLLHVRHDNIVNLLGYCDEREESALVFEYVSNGSLHDKLHHHHNWGGDSENRVLPWKSRMSIAFQLAQAIEYLHDQCKPQILHGDIKSSNVLLDDQLNCKLCDFGFSKMGFSSTVMRSSMSPSLMGSPGYMDPLYLRTGIASKKNDVYSFGVIILEMITGMEAFCPEKEELLTSIAGPIIRDADKVAEMVDPRVVDDFDFNVKEAKVMASIAGQCLRQQPSMRPSMLILGAGFSCGGGGGSGTVTKTHKDKNKLNMKKKKKKSKRNYHRRATDRQTESIVIVEYLKLL
ncbi:Protein kinase domain [Macleaya cordata]|uniref:Protein kinase domain n=1 Tax=Macleaya cordata TaxID=56857 RepID=A0A200QFW1_MACCD|nr:Protein kinase domain [Macleaya cordata]